VDAEPVITGAVKLQPGEHFGHDVVRIVVGRASPEPVSLSFFTLDLVKD